MLPYKIYSIPNTAIPALYLPQFLKVDAKPQTLCKSTCTRFINGEGNKTEIKMKPNK